MKRYSAARQRVALGAAAESQISTRFSAKRNPRTSGTEGNCAYCISALAGCQIEFVDLESIASPKRVAKFVKSADAQRGAVRLYCRNIDISCVAFAVIGMIEVALRNLADAAFAKAYGSDWIKRANLFDSYSNERLGSVAKLDFGPWEQIFYGEFDGKRPKRMLVKIIGE